MERNDLKKALKGQKITQMNRDAVELLREEINEKLAVIENTYGVKLDLGRIRFDGLSFKGTLNAELVATEDGSSGEKKKFERECRLYGFEPADYLHEIRLGGKYAGLKGKIVGFNSRAKRYPVLVRSNDGRQFKMSTGSVKTQIAFGKTNKR